MLCSLWLQSLSKLCQLLSEINWNTAIQSHSLSNSSYFLLSRKHEAALAPPSARQLLPGIRPESPHPGQDLQVAMKKE